MQPGTYGVNAITLGNTELLLTTTGGGEAVHLTAVADPDSAGRSAIPDLSVDSPWADRLAALANYDRHALLAARWSPTTLCGRQWAVMIGGDGGSLSYYGEEPAFAPTCRRCLALMDRLFPPPPPHPQLPLVAQLVADVVVEHGHAEIHDVPGDQHTELRRQIRSLVRAATGHPCQTLVHANIIFVVCEPLLQQHAAEHQKALAEAMAEMVSGQAPRPRPNPEWRLSWSTWAT